jgi:hypothetical protein
MSILVRFSPANMTAEQYDNVSSKVQESTDWLPDGLEIHVCFGEEGNLRVSEIWDSQEQLDAFGEKLMPILQENGIEFSGEPEILPIHNTEKR